MVEDHRELQTSLIEDREPLIDILNQRCARVYHLAIALLGNETEVIEVMEEVVLHLCQEAPLFDHGDTSSIRLDTLTLRVVLKHLDRRPSELNTHVDSVRPSFNDTGHHRERPFIDWSQ